MGKSIPKPYSMSRFYWTLPEARVESILKKFPDGYTRPDLANIDRNYYMFSDLINYQLSFVKLGMRFGIDSSTAQEIIYQMYDMSSSDNEKTRDQIWYERTKLSYMKSETRCYK